MSLDLASLKPLIPAMIPDEGQYFDVNVTLAASPSNFTVSIRTFSNGLLGHLIVPMVLVHLGLLNRSSSISLSFSCPVAQPKRWAVTSFFNLEMNQRVLGISKGVGASLVYKMTSQPSILAKRQVKKNPDLYY